MERVVEDIGRDQTDEFVLDSQQDDRDGGLPGQRTGPNMSPKVQNAIAVDLTASKKEDLKPTCSLIQKVGPHDDNDLDSSPRPSHHYSTKN